jgi:predicted dehydrogenase
MRVLVVGYGSIARRHIQNLQVAGADEIVVFRPSGRPSDAPAKIRFAPSIAEAIASQPQLAVVASPSARHMDALSPLLEAGIPCYVEKPPVTTLQDVECLRKLLHLAGPKPVTLSGCNLRFLPSLRRLRELVRSGAIGRPVRATLQAGQWLPDWRPGRDYRTAYSARREAGGGVIFDLIHEIDAARWLFGEFDEVRSLAGRFSELEIATEDTAGILLGRHSGPIVTIGLDYVSRVPVRRYEVVGDRGSLVWDLAARRLNLVAPGGTTTVDKDAASFDVAATYSAAMREFVSAVQQGVPTSQDLLDGLASNELALRAKAA